MRYKTNTGKPIGEVGDISSVGTAITRVSSLVKNPGSIGGVIIGFFNYFISVGSFITRSILRVRIGERTFGLFTIFVLFFYVWFLGLYNDAILEISSEMSTRGEGLFFEVLSLMIKIFIAIPQAILYLLNEDLAISTQTLGLSLVAFVIGLTHFFEVRTRTKRNVVIHSLYRGDSLFFSWLVGRQVRGKTITEFDVWMIIEPLCVLIVALLFYLAGLNDISFALAVSGICLFWEEYRFYSENRRFELDLMDSQLEAKYTATLQDQIDKKQKAGKEISSPQKASLSFESENLHRIQDNKPKRFTARIT